MTVDEVIKHAEEVARQNEEDAIIYSNCKKYKKNLYEIGLAENAEKKCCKCAEEHRQLAEWLKELKQLREQISSSEKPNKSEIPTGWIPVSERLPKTYGTVCATIKWDLCDLSSIVFGCYTKDEGWQLVDTEGNRCYDFTVIAWMPLQPYKEGSDKE